MDCHYGKACAKIARMLLRKVASPHLLDETQGKELTKFHLEDRYHKLHNQFNISLEEKKKPESVSFSKLCPGEELE
jgi:hypothetical protein